MADRASQAAAARKSAAAAAGGSRAAAAAASRANRGPRYGGTQVSLAALAKANPRSTPIGDALGTVAGSALDYISRPLYMVGDAIGGDFTSAAKNSLNFLLPGTQSVEAIAGSRNMPSQALEKRGVNFGGGVGGFIGRMATDVLLDPLTYLTFGTGAALKGGAQIGAATAKALAESGASSATAIARAQRAGLMTVAEAENARTALSVNTGAARETATKAWNAARGGPTVVAGVRVPLTAVRAINKVAGTNLKNVIPLVESKTVAKGLSKVGVGLNSTKGSPLLHSIFSPAGGEDPGAYQAMLGGQNTVNLHKAQFSREGRQIERAIEKAGKASGLHKIDASPTVSHLADAVDVGRQGAARTAQANERVASGAATAEDLAQIAAEPATTKAAYEWLAANSNHGARYKFPTYEDAVKAFGDPDGPAADSIMDVVQKQSKAIGDYADAAGVMYDKIDSPFYLTHLPANKATREAMSKLDDAMPAPRGTIRKASEGFTRHRALPTLKDWYEAEAKLGIKMVPELSVGHRLTVRGVSGASEALHAILMRELVRMYGARGPLPDMEKLDDALRAATEGAASGQRELDKLLNRSSSPMAVAARSEQALLRQERIAMSKALAEAKKKVSKRAGGGKEVNVSQHEAVVAAQKRLDDVNARIEAVKDQPRVKFDPVDISQARHEKITEATAVLDVAMAERAGIVQQVAEKIMLSAKERIQKIKDDYSAPGDGPAGAFATPELEQKALQNEQVNQARQEVARIEAELDPVIHQIARWIRETIQKANAAEKLAQKGKQDPLIPLGKARAALRRELKKGDGADKDKISELQDEVTYREEAIALDREQGVHTVGINDRLNAGRTKEEVYEIQKKGWNTNKSRKAPKGDEKQGAGKRKIVDYYDDAVEHLMGFPEVPALVTNPTPGGKAVAQAQWDAARQQVVDLRAAKSLADGGWEDVDLAAKFDAKRAAEDAETDAAFGAVPDAPAPAPAPLPPEPMGTAVPTGEAIPVGTQGSDIIPQAATDGLTWTQRQIVKLVRGRQSSGRWVSVKDKEGRGSIRIGGRTLAATPEDLAVLVDKGWLAPDLSKSGRISRIAPGPILLSEGKTYADAPAAIRDALGQTLDEVGSAGTNAAEDALARASAPVTKDELHIAQLEADIKSAVENGKIQALIERELGTLRSKRKAAKEQLTEAEKTARQDVIAPAKQAYEDAKAAEQAAKDYAEVLRAPPNARVVAAATRKRDKAVAGRQRAADAQEKVAGATQAAQAFIDSLRKADASYGDAVMATGFLRDAEDWSRIEETWKSFSDRYIPKGSSLDPNGGVLFDPEVAGQIKRIIERISPTMKSPTAMRKITRFIQGITRSWKSLVLATPGYHLRNMIDDGLRAYWAGARNPASFFQAVRMLQGKQVSVKIRGKVYTTDEIMSMANVHGIIGTGSQYHSEVGPAYERMTPRKALGGLRLPRKPGSGGVVNTSQAIGEWRENMTRLGTFIELMKNGENEIMAAKNTRDFLFDYNDVGQFIIKAKDFWSPFVTYSMKAIPFYAKTAVQRPGQIANLGAFMNNMTATAAVDYPGQIDKSLMPPGQELAFGIPHLPGVSDWLFGEGKTGTIDPSNLLGISAINQASPITFPQPAEGENAIGAALGTIPRGAARVFGSFGNPIANTGIEIGTGQDLRYGSARPDLVRMTPVPLAAQRLLSAVSGGNLNMPGYGMKTDSYTGQQVEGMSGNFMRLLNLFPPINQAGNYTTAATGVTEPLMGFSNPFVTESDRGRIGFARTMFGIPIRPADVSRDQFFASRRP